LHTEVNDLILFIDGKAFCAHVGICDWRLVGLLFFDIFFPFTVFV
jgi:hypothetical protein